MNSSEEHQRIETPKEKAGFVLLILAIFITIGSVIIMNLNQDNITPIFIISFLMIAIILTISKLLSSGTI